MTSKIERISEIINEGLSIHEKSTLIKKLLGYCTDCEEYAMVGKDCLYCKGFDDCDAIMSKPFIAGAS